MANASSPVSMSVVLDLTTLLLIAEAATVIPYQGKKHGGSFIFLCCSYLQRVLLFTALLNDLLVSDH